MTKFDISLSPSPFSRCHDFISLVFLIVKQLKEYTRKLIHQDLTIAPINGILSYVYVAMV